MKMRESTNTSLENPIPRIKKSMNRFLLYILMINAVISENMIT